MSRHRSLPWYLPALGGAVSAAVLASGLTLALTVRFGERMGPPPEREPELTRGSGAAFRIVALGDSITAGTGDARAGGYPGRLARMLRARGRQVALVNLAVPGAETGDALARLAGDASVRAEVARADLVVLSAGGNDLSHALRPQADRPLVDADRAAASAASNLRALAARLRSLNPTAPIRFIGLYDPFPFGVLPEEEADARGQLRQWNDLIERVTASHHGVMMVPVFDLFYDRPDRLAGDHYHPGSTGHELIAARILETLPARDVPLDATGKSQP